jgi:selenocysteine-specific elongation factor
LPLHAARPLDEGATLADAPRAAACHAARPRTRLIDALLARLASAGAIVRSGMTVRLPGHRVALDGHGRSSVWWPRSRAARATPPTVKSSSPRGSTVVIDAAAREGLTVRITPELVVSGDVVAELVRAHATDGVTVSALRERLGTSRKYAVPLAEWMDANGISRRVGDLRFPREDAT